MNINKNFVDNNNGEIYMKKIIVSVLLVLLVGVSTIMGTYAVIINVVSDNGVDKIVNVINIKDLLSDDNGNYNSTYYDVRDELNISDSEMDVLMNSSYLNDSLKIVLDNVVSYKLRGGTKLSNDDIYINKEEDINNPKLTNVFPNIVEKTKVDENGLEYFIKVTDNINQKNESKSKIAEKIFSFKKPIVTYSLIFICILVFILMYVLGNGSTDNYTLLVFGANVDTLTKNGDYYRLFTSMFLHIGILHLLCNMYSLYIIGKEVENVFGKVKYLIIYLLSGIAGSILSLAFNHNTICAGASGAIFGLLGALLYFGYYYRTYLGATLTRSIIPVIVLNLIIGFTSSGIDNAAHIGGLVGGILIAMAVGVPDKSNNNNKINGIVLSLIYFGFIIYLSFFR